MFLEEKISIRRISEGSRDTKDWSNEAENVALNEWINVKQGNI